MTTTRARTAAGRRKRAKTPARRHARRYTAAKVAKSVKKPPRKAREHRTEAERALAERLLAAARAGADVRSRKVRRLKAAIKVRVYENDLKFTVAMERLVAAAGEQVPAKKRTQKPDARRPAAPEVRNPKHEIRNKSKSPNRKAQNDGLA